MEVAAIDWKDSKFEKDELYEHINAPQWIDFSSPISHSPPHDDDAWFCRPDCNHPKTADDFFTKTLPNNTSKLQRSSNVDDQNQSSFSSNTPVKKRGTPMNKNSRNTKHVQDNENQNPNLLTGVDHPAVKLSPQKKKTDNEINSASQEPPRRLKSTFSARNLFAGNNILNQITEFCNELKRLATRKKERGDEKRIEDNKPDSGILKETQIQRKPLLSKVKDEDVDKSNSSNGKDKLTRKIRNRGLENSPIAENTRGKATRSNKAFGSRTRF